MKCHTCFSELSTIHNFRNYSDKQLDCRNPNCHLRQIAQRCRLIYNESYSKTHFMRCIFWVEQDKYWYEIELDNKIVIHQYEIELRSNMRPKQIGYEKIIDLEHAFKISLNDDLIVKVPQILKRAKNLVIFS